MIINEIDFFSLREKVLEKFREFFLPIFYVIQTRALSEGRGKTKGVPADLTHYGVSEGR